MVSKKEQLKTSLDCNKSSICITPKNMDSVKANGFNVNSYSYKSIVSTLQRIIKTINGQVFYSDKNKVLIVADSQQILSDVAELINNTIINFKALNKSSVNIGETGSNFIIIGEETRCAPIHRHNLVGNVLDKIVGDEKNYFSQIEKLKTNYDFFLILAENRDANSEAISALKFNYTISIVQRSNWMGYSCKNSRISHKHKIRSVNYRFRNNHKTSLRGINPTVKFRRSQSWVLDLV